jgi:hypothetical protein
VIKSKILWILCFVLEVYSGRGGVWQYLGSIGYSCILHDNRPGGVVFTFVSRTQLLRDCRVSVDIGPRIRVGLLMHLLFPVES